jgi:hypothetical protein
MTPERDPIEALKRRAIGALFKGAPIGFDLDQVAVDRNRDRNIRSAGANDARVRGQPVVELHV